MEIVAVATYAMDVLMKVDRLPAEDGFAVVTNNTYLPGGSGTNVLVQAARLGAKCGFLGLLGDDSLGDDILDSLHSEGINTDAVRRKENGISLHTDIVVDAAGKKFILLNMGDSFLAYDASAADLDYIRSAKVYYTDLLPVRPAVTGLRAAKEAGLATAFNMQVELAAMEGFGASRDDILNSLKWVDLFAPCRAGLYALCGSDDPQRCLEFLRPYFKGTLVLTLGSAGSLAFDEQNHRFEQPIFKVDTIDTTGAGDAYMGAMLWARLLKHKSLGEAMRFATACSAITCQSLGARSGPTLAQTQQFLASV